MSAHNTRMDYGYVTRSFHWLTFLLIATVIPLGVIADRLPYDTSEALARKAFLFSLHKTVGVTIFFVALGRIAWAISQPKPMALHPERTFETFLAEVVHWVLYASLLLVPLSGWIHHAATEGFAPILFGFGQSLPFVPKSPGLAHLFSGLHMVFERVLVVALVLHVAGALKHVFVDRDKTLARMWFGDTRMDQGFAAVPVTRRWHKLQSVAVVGAAYVCAIGIGAWIGVFSGPGGAGPVLAVAAEAQSGNRHAAAASQWQVREGRLGIAVRQLGARVEGSFADWTAAIDFDETATDGRHGQVRVEIAVSSLTIGDVTTDAVGPEFLDAATFPTAIFTAQITPAPTGAQGAYLAEGTLEMRGMEIPVVLPFTLEIEGDTATMEGTTQIDRRAFGVGKSYPDDSTVGFEVEVTVALSAVRGAP